MAELFLEDPTVLTKERLKSELAAHSVPLPSGEQHRKEVYVQLYLKNLTVLNNNTSTTTSSSTTKPPPPPSDPFSSDDELPTPVVSNRSRSGRVRVCYIVYNILPLPFIIIIIMCNILKILYILCDTNLLLLLLLLLPPLPLFTTDLILIFMTLQLLP